MMHGVLNMPIECWYDDAINQGQRYSVYKEASARIIDLEARVAELELFQRNAFDAYPNIDISFESLEAKS